MSDRRLFMILLIILVLSIALLVYAKTQVGPNFIEQF